MPNGRTQKTRKDNRKPRTMEPPSAEHRQKQRKENRSKQPDRKTTRNQPTERANSEGHTNQNMQTRKNNQHQRSPTPMRARKSENKKHNTTSNAIPRARPNHQNINAHDRNHPKGVKNKGKKGQDRLVGRQAQAGWGQEQASKGSRETKT